MEEQKIIINRNIRKFCEGFPREDHVIDTLIIHCTAGGSSAAACLKWMAEGGIMPDGKKRKADYKKGVALFHYIIDRTGEITEVINPHNYVYHSSTGAVDKMTIGVELVNHDRNNAGNVTSLQYKSLAFLVGFICLKVNKIKVIQGHGSIKRQYTGKYKVCPGPGFDWGFFKNKLTELTGIEYEFSGNEKLIRIERGLR